MSFLSLGKILDIYYRKKDDLLRIISNEFIVEFPVLAVYFFIFFIINIFSWWLCFLFVQKTINYKIVFLHYNVDFGVNLIGNANNIYQMPISGLIIFIFNFLLAIFFRKNKFLVHLLLTTGILVNMAVVFSVFFVFSIN